MARFFNIITQQASGLGVDASVIVSALEAGGLTTVVRYVRTGRINSLSDRIIPQLLGRLIPTFHPKANLFCEQIYPKWVSSAKINLLIPNQEWCRPETVRLLPKMDQILCKTRYAEEIYGHLGHNVSYIGFTSQDKFAPSIPKDYRKFLHIAGQSLQKGTAILAKVWSSHPEWPTLTIVTRKHELITGFEAPNIRVLGTLSAHDLIALQNECGVHVCPSEAEGFGHTICEGLGCGAIIVTTDAPPMNELITPERGFLTAFGATKPQTLGTNYYVDAFALEKTILQILEMTDDDLSIIGTAARNWFLREKTAFQDRITKVMRNI